MRIEGNVRHLTSPHQQSDGSSAPESLYQAILRSRFLLWRSILFSTIGSCAYLYLLRRYARPLVWLNLVALPVSFGAIGIWLLTAGGTGALRDRLGGQDVPDNWLYIFGSVSCLCSAWLGLRIWRRRDGVEFSVKIVDVRNLGPCASRFPSKITANPPPARIQLSCQVLVDAPALFAVPLILIGLFIIYVMLWLAVFSRNFYGDADGGAAMGFFLIFILWWTISVIRSTLRFTVAGTVSWWFYQRNEAAGGQTFVEQKNLVGSKNVELHLKRALTTSFGTVVLGSLILTAAQISYAVLAVLRRYTNVSLTQPSAAGFHGSIARRVLGPVIAAMVALTDSMTNFALTYAAVSDEDFLASARGVTRLFRRNLLYGTMSDPTVKTMLVGANWLVSTGSGFGIWVYATHELGSYGGWLVGVVGGLICFGVISSCSGIIVDT